MNHNEANRSCDGCALCCKLLAIPWMNSPEGEYCSKCDKGCTIYKTRPKECENFDCLWLGHKVLGEDLRPDRCGVMFELYKEEKTVIGMVDDGNWKEGNVKLLINQMLSDKYVVWIIEGKEKHLLLPENVSEEEAKERAKEAWRRRVWQPQHIHTI